MCSLTQLRNSIFLLLLSYGPTEDHRYWKTLKVKGKMISLRGSGFWKEMGLGDLLSPILLSGLPLSWEGLPQRVSTKSWRHSACPGDDPSRPWTLGYLPVQIDFHWHLLLQSPWLLGIHIWVIPLPPIPLSHHYSSAVLNLWVVTSLGLNDPFIGVLYHISCM
jgi:hypothetical protein